jgi:hypothetical protein
MTVAHLMVGKELPKGITARCSEWRLCTSRLSRTSRIGHRRPLCKGPAGLHKWWEAYGKRWTLDILLYILPDKPTGISWGFCRPGSSSSSILLSKVCPCDRLDKATGVLAALQYDNTGTKYNVSWVTNTDVSFNHRACQT